MRGKVLIIDDDRSMCELLDAGLKREGFEVVFQTSASDPLPGPAAEDIDVLVTDLNMPGMNGLQLCESLSSSRPDLPVIVITAFGSLDTAVGAIRAGAYDFITKPFDIEVLALALDRAVRLRRLKGEVRRLQEAVSRSGQFQELIGESPHMRRMFDLIHGIRDTDAAVLISGETGTGKELVARAIHNTSRRAAGPFLGLNCAAVPEQLLESELFGHVKGAFTDAKSERKGLFLSCHGGTLFLDEIGDMPLALQPKLLRVLQERVIRQVGSDAEMPIDVRILAASHEDIETAIEEKRFRQDLFFRLNVINLEVPPLRSRGNDILLLAQSFLERAAARSGRSILGLSPQAAEKLLGYGWPGNVRELINCIERAVALTQFERLAVEDLPEKIRQPARPGSFLASDNPAELLTLNEMERRYILRVLDAVGQSKTQAAKVLGLDRKTLYRKLEHFDKKP